MWRDLQYGFRQMRRNRLFSGIVMVLLAAGIGANTLVLSLVNELLLKPLPVRNPDNLYLLQAIKERQVRPQDSFGYLEFRNILSRHLAFAAVIAEQEQTQTEIVPLSTASGMRLAMTQMVSPNYFSELGVQAIAGRLLGKADAKASGTIPAVLSYQFWQSQFGADRGIIGRQIRLKDYPFQVDGILPREFHSSDIDRAPFHCSSGGIKLPSARLLE